jgi:hypothetical protein
LRREVTRVADGSHGTREGDDARDVAVGDSKAAIVGLDRDRAAGLPATMRTIPAILVSLCLACLPACGGEAVKAVPEQKAADAKAADAKVTDTKAADAKVADAKAEPVHFDITQDKSGVLARAASTLETSEAVTNPALKEHLAGLSHHAEKGPTNEALCKHMKGLMGEAAPSDLDCIHALEHQRVHLGPEVFDAVAACVTGSKTLDALQRCEDAEKEAEKELHAKKHGTGVEPATCTELFAHFEKLAMADAGDQGKAVEEILEEVRGDVLEACAEQGTRAEVDCALKAKTMQELGACESALL